MKKKSVIGMEISDASIKWVMGERGEGGALSIKQFGVHDGAPASPKALEKFITDTLVPALVPFKAQKIPVFASFAGAGSMIRRVSIPVAIEKDLPNAIRMEIRRHIPFPVESVTLDYSPIPSPGPAASSKQEFLVMVAQQTAVDIRAKLLLPMGLPLHGLAHPVIGLWQSVKLAFAEPPSGKIAVVDLGANGTVMAFFQGGRLEFMREISIGESTLIRALTAPATGESAGMGLSTQQADTLLKTIGIPAAGQTGSAPDGTPLEKVSKALEPVWKQMMTELLRSMDYYKETFKAGAPEKIYLMGGASQIPGIAEPLTAALGIQVQTLPWMTRVTVDPSLDQNKFRPALPRLGVAIGMAMDAGETLNYLKKRPTGSIKEVLADFMTGPKRTVAIAALAGLLLMGWGTTKVMSWRVASMETRVKTLQTTLTEARAVAERRRMAVTMTETAKPVLPVVVEAVSLLPDSVALRAIEWDRKDKIMKLEGTAPSPAEVGEVISALERSTFFGGVSVEGMVREGTSEASRLGFKVSAPVVGP